MSGGSGPETDRELDFYNEGFEDGYNQGSEGQGVDSYNAGYGDGYDEGYDDGHDAKGFLKRVARPTFECIAFAAITFVSIVMGIEIIVNRLR